MKTVIDLNLTNRLSVIEANNSVLHAEESIPLTYPCCELNIATEQRLYSQSVSLILKENEKTLYQVNSNIIQQFITRIIEAKRIFLTGEGRSGLVARMFAMRLMHLGYQVYVVGETTTPPIRHDDLLIACSGSGSTTNTFHMASESKKSGARIVCVTTQINSPLAKIAHLTLEIKAASKHDRNHKQSKQFAGSLFEQSSLILFDAIFHLLCQQMEKNSDALWNLHTNLE